MRTDRKQGGSHLRTHGPKTKRPYRRFACIVVNFVCIIIYAAGMIDLSVDTTDVLVLRKLTHWLILTLLTKLVCTG